MGNYLIKSKSLSTWVSLARENTFRCAKILRKRRYNALTIECKSKYNIDLDYLIKAGYAVIEFEQRLRVVGLWNDGKKTQKSIGLVFIR